MSLDRNDFTIYDNQEVKRKGGEQHGRWNRDNYIRISVFQGFPLQFRTSPCVSFSGFDIAVPQKITDIDQVNTRLQQMDRLGMAKMGSSPIFNQMLIGVVGICPGNYS